MRYCYSRIHASISPFRCQNSENHDTSRRSLSPFAFSLDRPSATVSFFFPLSLALALVLAVPSSFARSLFNKRSGPTATLEFHIFSQGTHAPIAVALVRTNDRSQTAMTAPSLVVLRRTLQGFTVVLFIFDPRARASVEEMRHRIANHRDLVTDTTLDKKDANSNVIFATRASYRRASGRHYRHRIQDRSWSKLINKTVVAAVFLLPDILRLYLTRT